MDDDAELEAEIQRELEEEARLKLEQEAAALREKEDVSLRSHHQKQRKNIFSFGDASKFTIEGCGSWWVMSPTVTNFQQHICGDSQPDIS